MGTRKNDVKVQVRSRKACETVPDSGADDDPKGEHHDRA
ncbi:hypothetical protein NONO_c01160 [Nocardia nova SH22a]|uniref:Uncharacterized protein n=1 Tax=Nocardia nova SH22a TaxID=1415166 RepID=W5TCJ5_9NOCA|nr:hypothetical protein NONO_c01160 [Nocardia nova SH22a]